MIYRISYYEEKQAGGGIVKRAEKHYNTMTWYKVMIMNGTILQVIFAFLFGLVAAEISILTESIFIPIIWHTVHNFISYTSATWPKTSELILFAVQCVVLLGYGIYLWKAISRYSLKRGQHVS